METRAIYDLIRKNGCSTDTRTLASGQVFIALKGENFDANELALTAIEQGASYAVVDSPVLQKNDQCIVVTNTHETLKELAIIHRHTFSIPIIVIGGSNGKTTTKELTKAVLQKRYRTHATNGNFNNDIGVPLTLLNMPIDTEIAVIEIGANHPGEHTELMTIASPTHVLITNNGADHLEGFGTLEGVRKANKEIYDMAQSQHAHVFVNKDIEYLIEDSAHLERTLYPTKPYASTSSLYASVCYDDTDLTTSLFGSYNEPNILAAIAIGEYFDVPLLDIQQAIKEYVPSLKRSQILTRDTYSIVLDCYNANPSSMEVALRDFARDTTPGHRFFIIGDMLEMGTDESRLHKEILHLVESLTSTGDTVWCIGPRFSAYKADFPFTFFETTTTPREIFGTLDLTGKTVFLKASRGIKLENVVM
jgi:UDP-N-acetylmuramoyl-tripeptide--D-alanyl-D-alanine ligase